MIVLVIEPGLRLDANGLAGLEVAVQGLRRAGCDLVVCAADSATFLTLAQSSAGRLLGTANLCSDAEFAEARVMDLLPGLGVRRWAGNVGA